MITYTTGSIFESDANCIVNPVNCVGIMGKGLALEFKRKYPDMFTFYKNTCHTKDFYIGRLIFYTDKESSKIICLFPTKYHWRETSTLATIQTGLEQFLAYAPKANVKSVAFPKIGCGLGGLNFEHEVKPLMEKYLAPSNFDVRIHI